MQADGQPDLLDQRPRTFIAKTGAEYLDLCRRHKAGEFHISIVEIGYQVADGVHTNGKPKFSRNPYGYTVRVYYRD